MIATAHSSAISRRARLWARTLFALGVMDHQAQRFPGDAARNRQLVRRQVQARLHREGARPQAALREG